ncbi:FKBP-type peptidyl-prolyl cis-trans isomerase, trigger factor [Gottschalkia acidurici 9a]|uniref:Trigger factor n=1 Tax=Gottschalkia acidurici (strain ATCC 7906 / DSM 604 / BCRC 14475 / CIP 104303 / KCTC 5404 / NCIMB 10678 / 9a) TaxID=1128398 RepID=K0AUB7_GOTA9|nr:trigger factor [Gottschalkia acidurici]AFS77418.1 FKBP-type peptidyl-prolyl cis-trans isomerase, trigger factor [Gottschalkia acidurici 9a]
MSSKIEKKENNKVTLKIEVSYEEFEKEVQQAYNRSKGRFNIPGFRKGKVPRKIIETNYGEGVFYEDAINGIFPKVYDEAIKEHGLDTIDRPSLDLDQIEKGKPVVFIVEVEVKPEVKLGEYKGIEVEKKEYNVTEEDIDAELKNIQERNARLVEVEDRASQEGDTLTIDYSGFIGEEQFEGGTAKNQPLELGSNSFIPGFEEQLVGKNAGEEVDVKVNFPEDYHALDLAGKEAIFKVKIHEIKLKELPSLDDELAKDVSEFDTLEELKADLKSKLEEGAEKREKAEFENSTIEKVCELSEVEVPEVLVERQIDSSVQDFAYRLRFQGLELERYLELTGTKIQDFREQFREDAQKLVKGDLVLEAIAEKEGIEASEEELNTELENIAKQYKQELEQVKKHLQMKI